MQRHLALISLVLATAASSVFSTTTSLASTSEPGLCFGQVPTIVGSPDEPFLSGTDDADVVMTNGSQHVASGGGDDLVCITGEVPPLPSGSVLQVETGSGNDRVDAAQSETTTSTWLGDGADEFLGGAASESVHASEPRMHELVPEQSVDVITTKGGRDFVDSDGPDVIALGSAADELYLSALSGDAILKGGAGEDFLAVWPQNPGAHAWTLDNSAERLLRDGETTATWHSFVMFSVDARGPITFLGSDADESFEFHGAPDPDSGYWLPNAWPVGVRMNRGDDVVQFHGGAEGSRFDGGNGRDELQYERNYLDIFTPPAKILFDLARGLLRDTTKSMKITNRSAVDFEDAAVLHSNGATTLKGTAGPNNLDVRRSGAGYPLEPSSATIYGRGGDDHMSGNRADDLLVGGAGYDVAKGGGGIDRCRAEVRTRCEA